jgi:hypothetical protein
LRRSRIADHLGPDFEGRPDNRLVEQHGFTTRKNAHNDTEWIRPPHLDHGQPRTNTFHHPDKLLTPDDDEPD